MFNYQCATCDKIVSLKPAQVALVFQQACPGCQKTNTLKPYKGEIHGTVLDQEDAQFQGRITAVANAKVARDTAKAALDVAAKAHRDLEHRFDRSKNLTPAEINGFRDNIKASHDVLIAEDRKFKDADQQHRLAVDRLDNLGNRKAVRAKAPEAYAMSENVEEKTKKNRLYIGSRQHVSAYAAQKDARKGRILNVDVWSPALNVAWVEGGIKAKAQFKLKLNPDKPYDTISAEVLDAFRETPDMDAMAFLTLCQKSGKDSLLWYDRDGASRPTWTAMEIWCLLRVGYRFEFADRSAGKQGQKIVLIPPA